MSSDRFRGGEFGRGRRGDFEQDQSRYGSRSERYGQSQEGRGSDYREQFEQDRWGQGEGPSGPSQWSSRGEGRRYSQGQADGEPYERGEGRYGQGSQQYGRPYGSYGMNEGYGDAGRSREADGRESRSYGYGGGRSEFGSQSRTGGSGFGTSTRGFSADEESWRPSDRFDGYDRSSEPGRGGRGRSGSFESGPSRWGSESGSESFGSAPMGQGRMGSGTSGGFGRRMKAAFSPGRFTGKGPKGYQRSDDRIKEDVSEALERDGDLDASEIEVLVVSGEVTLQGMVPDRESKRLAEDLVEDLAGVKQVHNQLRIENGRDKELSASGSASRSASSTSSSSSTGKGSNRS